MISLGLISNPGFLTGNFQTALDSLPLWMYGGLASAFALGAFLMSLRQLEFEQG